MSQSQTRKDIDTHIGTGWPTKPILNGTNSTITFSHIPLPTASNPEKEKNDDTATRPAMTDMTVVECRGPLCYLFHSNVFSSGGY